MSIVTVQLGQCGNQVGEELFDIICSDAPDGQRKAYSTASTERFFHQNTHGGKGRAVPLLYWSEVWYMCLSMCLFLSSN